MILRGELYPNKVSFELGDISSVIIIGCISTFTLTQRVALSNFKSMLFFHYIEKKKNSAGRNGNDFPV